MFLVHERGPPIQRTLSAFLPYDKSMDDGGWKECYKPFLSFLCPPFLFFHRCDLRSEANTRLRFCICVRPISL